MIHFRYLGESAEGYSLIECVSCEEKVLVVDSNSQWTALEEHIQWHNEQSK